MLADKVQFFAAINWHKNACSCALEESECVCPSRRAGRSPLVPVNPLNLQDGNIHVGLTRSRLQVSRDKDMGSTLF